MFHYELGRYDRALEIYDNDVLAEGSEDFRDIANEASLLWRLRLEGVDVGERFDQLHGLALKRVEDATLVFSSLHHLLIVLAKDDAPAA